MMSRQPSVQYYIVRLKCGEYKKLAIKQSYAITLAQAEAINQEKDPTLVSVTDEAGNTIWFCAICHRNSVNVDNEYDTCDSCINNK